MAVIAMTREIGSLGTNVAAGLASRLGLNVIGSECVVERVTLRLGIKPNRVLRFVEGRASLLDRWKIDRRKLFHYAAEELLHLVQQNNIVITGWGAATLLRDLRGVLSVRICAPISFRLRVLMERLGTTDAAAVRARIERDHAARARMMRAYFDVEEEDAHLYHIVLNTERLSIEACVKTVADLAESRRFRHSAATCSALADKLLEARINSAFAEHISASMAPLGVEVLVANGKVTLAGMSCSGRLRKAAEDIAQQIAGSVQIDNRIISVPSHGRPVLSGGLGVSDASCRVLPTRTASADMSSTNCDRSVRRAGFCRGQDDCVPLYRLENPFRNRSAKIYFKPVRDSTNIPRADFGALIAVNIGKWGKVVQTAKVKAD
jgi:cytidylate kinase